VLYGFFSVLLDFRREFSPLHPLFAILCDCRSLPLRQLLVDPNQFVF
jgi:hypothetical protein